MRRVTSLDAGMLDAKTRKLPLHTMGVAIPEPSPDQAPFPVV